MGTDILSRDAVTFVFLGVSIVPPFGSIDVIFPLVLSRAPSVSMVLLVRLIQLASISTATVALADDCEGDDFAIESKENKFE